MAGRGRSGSQTVFVAAVASGQTVEAAAAVAQVSPRTAWRWMARPDVRGEIAAVRRRMVDRALGVLADGLLAATVKMRHLVLSADDEKTQLAAAKAVTETLVRLRQATELEERIAAIEERLANGEEPGTAG
jgi:hypothetical protein